MSHNHDFSSSPRFEGELMVEYRSDSHSLFVISLQLRELYHLPASLPDVPKSLITSGFIHPESERDLNGMMEELQRGRPFSQRILKTQTASGESLWISFEFTAVFDTDGPPVRAIGILKDMTAQKRAEIRKGNGLLYQEALLKDALLYYEANLTTERVITGLENLFKKLKLTYTDSYADSLDLICQHIIHPMDRKRMASYLSCRNLLSIYSDGGNKASIEYRRLDDDGSYRWAKCNVFLMDEDQTGCVNSCYYVYDNHEEKLRELELLQKAERDLLTGLYNKMTAEMLIEEAVFADQATGGRGAFFMIDLDNFKMVNDTLGHAFGDAVLSEIAHKLKTLCCDQDIAGRIGGDEFALYFRHLPDKEAVEAKARDVCAQFRNAYSGAFQNFRLSGTVGIALSPTDGNTFRQLYTNADTALYTAKKQGKDGYCFYDRNLQAQNTSPDFTLAAIDSNYRKSFAENLSEYVFRIMYEARQLHPAVNAILELLSNHFGFDRCYLYETSEFQEECYKTYEWHSDSVPPLPETMNCLSKKTLEECRERLCKGDFYLYSALNTKDTDTVVFPKQEDLYFRFQCQLSSYGRFHGFAGFDQYVPGRHFSASELASIRVAAQMLGFFLETKYTEDTLSQTMDALSEVGSDIKICNYMVDLETYQITYVRSSVPNRFPNAVTGAYCYQAIRGKEVPCEDCPARKALRDKKSFCSMEWDYKGKRMKTYMVFARRKDETVSCLLSCYEIYGGDH